MIILPDPAWYSLNIMNTIIFFVDIFILSPEIISKTNILWSLIVSIIFSILDYKFSGISLIFAFILIMIFFKKTSYSLFYKFFLFIFSFVVGSITENMAIGVVFSFFKRTSLTSKDTTVPIILAIMLNLILSVLITFVYKIISQKGPFKSIFKDKTSIKVLLVTSVILLISYGCLMSIFAYLKLNFLYLMMNIIISIVISVVISISAIFLISSRSKEIKIESEIKQMEERDLYIKELEQKNNQLRKFKHDYKNLLLSLSTSLKSDNSDNESIEKLLTYADKNVDSTLNIEDTNLYHLDDKLIRGIIFTKMVSAKNKGIKTDFEIDKNVSINPNKSAEITRILGILLDNSIEASTLSDKSILDFAIVSFDKYNEFIVKNSFKADQEISINSVYKNGYTTKKNHTGLGLSTVKDIVDSNDNLFIQTKIDKNFFTTILTVLEDE